MANSTNSPEKPSTTEQPPSQSDNPNPSVSDLPDPSPSSSTVPPQSSSIPPPANPNPNLQQQTAVAPPPQIQPYSTVPPSFRPPVPLPSVVPQFSPIPNPNFQNHGIPPQGQGQVQPPGVMMYGQPGQHPGQPGQPPVRMYSPMPNGYHMAVNPPGIIRYAPPYPQMIRPAYPLRPLGPGGVQVLQRPPMMLVRGPVPTIMRPPINPNIPQAEKPMTTIYVGKIASTVDNDFMLSLLQLCGPVKSWKRVPDPTTGALKGFGFCEFESVEGVLRALRILSNLSIDGQELMLNFDKATKEYLKRYVEKKKENTKNQKATDAEGAVKEEDKEEPPKPSIEELKEVKKEDDNNESNKENDDYSTFGLVTDDDNEADREASAKLTGMIEERIKNKPLPPPPPPPQIAPDVLVAPTSEHLAKSRDGDSDLDTTRNVEDRNDEEMISKSIPLSESEKAETSSPDRNNRRSKDRDRDLKREKERELERYEREREQERAKRERDREYKIREDERRYRARLKDWESREKEKERARKQEREREKEREHDRKSEIFDQENDDSYSKKRKYRSSGEEREERKRRLREKEDDIDDKIREEEETAEAKKKEEEERERQKEQQKHALEILSNNTTNGSENAMAVDGSLLEIRNKAVDHETNDVATELGNGIGNNATQNGTGEDSVMVSVAASETKQGNTVQTKKLGFGLVGSGKRTTVPSLFHEEEDEEAHKDKKMRPLVPIDYSTEELQAVRETTPLAPSSSLAAAAEFAKRIGHASSKEERPESERERSRRAHDRSGHRDREEASRSRDETREKERERGSEKVKTPDNKKLLDAKQLIDTIPKTKDELFSYRINWAVYDKNGLHERMRPWISKKITEFLGEEEMTLVDYIVSSTQEHVTANEMFDRLQSILDDEAEMFVLKMWRMLIFEIKKVETGLAGKTKA
uniref:RNA-binding protein 25 n=1 Tax=Erigeron canadensis TaxID=72917 RepID=UPI001CB958C2|nr:RNA-binding protein 25 [Erigeron canadensis]